MKKYIIIFFCLFFISACSETDKFDHQGAEKPNLTRSPLQGRWIVTKVVSSNDQSNEKMRQLIGKDAIFSPNVSIFYKQILESPNYTMTKVDTDNFLNLRYNKTRKDFTIMSDKLFLVEIHDSEEKIFEVLREKEDVAYIDIYGNLLQLVKTKEELNDKQVDILKNSTSTEKVFRSSIKTE